MDMRVIHYFLGGRQRGKYHKGSEASPHDAADAFPSAGRAGV